MNNLLEIITRYALLKWRRGYPNLRATNFKADALISHKSIYTEKINHTYGCKQWSDYSPTSLQPRINPVAKHQFNVVIETTNTCRPQTQT